MVNPDVQAQLQEEIDFVFDGKEEGEDLSADDLTNMPYLEQVNNSMQARGSWDLHGVHVSIFRFLVKLQD